MSLTKMPFISSVQLARIDESTIIPTSIYYKDKKPLVGKEALSAAQSSDQIVEDFKIDIGRSDPDVGVRKTVVSEATPRRTAAGLVKDFFTETLNKIDNWLSINGHSAPAKILIAEPLSLGGSEMADEAWLANYRKAIKKALYGRFAEIDFMPEPFAVFQYYRYGLRHPLVSEQRKHVALVLDFGGGTFDVSIVETTKTGEISGGGANSRPLGARSAQVGGFFINRLIAEEIIFKDAAKSIDKGRVRKSLKFFYENKNAEDDFLSKMVDSERAFFINLKNLLHTVEGIKLSICNSIANWSLGANLAGVAPHSIAIPIDLYRVNGDRAYVKFDAKNLQRIYIDEIWNNRLKSTIVSTIQRSERDLSGQQISVVLLSGGSSNIRWLRPLIERDMGKYLDGAQILELSENFQEIVAKGLATECARRHFTGGQGDFRAVTYNRLCLLLRADDGELEHKNFKPQSEAISHISETDINVLLPSASSLRGLVGQSLQWKIKPSKLPKRHLSYYFMRSSFDPEDLDARHNVVDTRVYTPPGTQFQQNIFVELVVREDGTAEPRFVYGKNDKRAGTIVAGKPFYIDMTFAADEVPGETYLGFDFGTSTSACSYITSESIGIIEQRTKSADWLELSELVTELPYSISTTLARYMSEMEPHRRSERGREAVESMLTLFCYVGLADLCCTEKLSTSYFKGMAHRSAGPLWGLAKQLCRNVRQSQFLIANVQNNVIKNETYFDEVISGISSAKHDKKTIPIDFVSLLTSLGNLNKKMLDGWYIGVFESVVPKRFQQGKFRGIFRILRGPAQTFINVFEYEGNFSFNNEDVFAVNPDKRLALSLSPLFIWNLSESGQSSFDSDLFEYDSQKKEIHIFRAVQSGAVVEVGKAGQYAEVASFLDEIKIKEVSRQAYREIDLLMPTL